MGEVALSEGRVRVEAERSVGEREGEESGEGRREGVVATPPLSTSSSRRIRPPFDLIASTNPVRLKPVHLRSATSSTFPPVRKVRKTASVKLTPSNSTDLRLLNKETEMLEPADPSGKSEAEAEGEGATTRSALTSLKCERAGKAAST